MPPPPIYHFLLHFPSPLYIPFSIFIHVPNAQFLRKFTHLSLFIFSTMASLPPDIQQHLPDRRMPVLAFLAIRLPKVINTNHFIQPEKYISSSPPNLDDIKEMLGFPIPSPDVVNALQHLIQKPEQNVGSILCPHVTTAGGKRFPSTVVLCWARLLEICNVQSKWENAVRNLQMWMTWEPESALAQRAFQVLTNLPWSNYLNGIEEKIETHILSAFLTTEWLSNDHEQLMLELLKMDLQNNGQHDVLVDHTAFALLLTAAYEDRGNYTSNQHYAWLRKRGEDLATGQKSSLVTIVNQNSNHWIGTIIDFKARRTLYGDSMKVPISTNLQQVPDWWTGYHTHFSFTYHNLPISRQLDSVSCGVLAWDSLRCYLLKTKPPLIDATQMHDARFEIFLHLVRSYCSNQVNTTTTHKLQLTMYL